jgi:hypothetical protein
MMKVNGGAKIVQLEKVTVTRKQRYAMNARWDYFKIKSSNQAANLAVQGDSRNNQERQQTRSVHHASKARTRRR